ncbi:MAG TPA: hypothetical protein VK427_14200 [Kofleriaceae bacterium]|nr:hypothetical protein [Kofleriaceae bacterium]
MRKQFSFLLAGLASVAACSPYDPKLGDSPYLCAEQEPFCPDGYSCQETTGASPRKVCVSGDGLAPDASMAGFPCADDSSLEGSARNDMLSNAFLTPVDGQRLDLSLAGLALCPEGDKDHYAITLSSGNKSIEVTVSWEGGQPISMSLLNAAGSSIMNGVANGTSGLRACVPSLPTGTYYAAVFASGMTKQNYRMSIKVLPNCAN